MFKVKDISKKWLQLTAEKQKIIKYEVGYPAFFEYKKEKYMALWDSDKVKVYKIEHIGSF